jgi:hypothetical protein
MFAHWRNGTAWDAGLWFSRVEQAAVMHTTSRAWLAVLPDRIADPSSMAFSLDWLERVAHFPLPWFLAVQDGMTEADVAPHLHSVTGLFLGGSDAFKATAPLWSRLAHEHNRLFHYGRAGTPAKLLRAREANADSADSTRPVRSRADFQRFRYHWLHGDPQLPLLNGEASLLTSPPKARKGDGSFRPLSSCFPEVSTPSLRWQNALPGMDREP